MNVGMGKRALVLDKYLPEEGFGFYDSPGDYTFTQLLALELRRFGYDVELRKSLDARIVGAMDSFDCIIANPPVVERDKHRFVGPDGNETSHIAELREVLDERGSSIAFSIFCGPDKTPLEQSHFYDGVYSPGRDVGPEELARRLAERDYSDAFRTKEASAAI